jgi:hypothetical protein
MFIWWSYWYVLITFPNLSIPLDKQNYTRVFPVGSPEAVLIFRLQNMFCGEFQAVFNSLLPHLE